MAQGVCSVLVSANRIVIASEHASVAINDSRRPYTVDCFGQALAMTQKHHCEQTTCKCGNQQARDPKQLLALKPPQIFEKRRRGDEQPGGDDEQNPACRGQVWQAITEHDS